MSYENTSCPCGGRKERETMICDACKAFASITAANDLALYTNQYRYERKLRGTQTSVADALGISRVTIMRRETARSTVTREAMIALLTLPKKDSTDSTRSA